MTAHLLLIDGLNLVRPIYETNPSSDPTEKLDGVLTTLNRSFLRALEQHTPTHLAWVFERRCHTWRHDIYPEYKSSRETPPPLMLEVVRHFRQQMADQGVKTMEYEGLEADDVIACIAARARKAGIKVTVLSTDKDLPFLLTLGVGVYNHFSRSWHDAEWCERKLGGIQPHQILDCLALMGDSADDIPGVSKIGVTTAGALLNKYGDLEGVLAAAAAGQIKGVRGARLVEEAHLARLSRQLTDLKFDCVTDPLRLTDFKVQAPAHA